MREDGYDLREREMENEAAEQERIVNDRDDWQVVYDALLADSDSQEAFAALARLREREAYLMLSLSDKEIERQDDVIRAVEAAEARIAELEAENRGLLFDNAEREVFDAALARVAELETENAIHQQNIETAARMNQRLEEALRHIKGWAEDEVLSGPPELGLILGEARRALVHKEEK